MAQISPIQTQQTSGAFPSPSGFSPSFNGLQGSNGAAGIQGLQGLCSNGNSQNSIGAGMQMIDQEMSQMMTMMTTMMMLMMTKMMSGLGGGSGAGVSPVGGSSAAGSPTSGGSSGGGSDPTSSSSPSSSSGGDSGPVGSISNPTDFAKALLKKLGDPETDANIKSIVEWEKREGGNWNNSAHFNPLNTTEKENGATSMNSVGVKAYTSWDQGVDATVQCLQNGKYADLLAALKTGKGLATGSYKGLSTWSGGGYSSI